MSNTLPDTPKIRLLAAQYVLLVSMGYENLIALPALPVVRAEGLRMKARALVAHDRILTGRKV